LLDEGDQGALGGINGVRTLRAVQNASTALGDPDPAPTLGGPATGGPAPPAASETRCPQPASGKAARNALPCES